jgi:pimeloyl-ACP methyl ester carboxylesterase
MKKRIAPKSSSAGAASYRPPLVIAIHGINTTGQWQKEFAAAMSDSGIHAESYDYGNYTALQFLSSSSNRKKIDEFYVWFCKTVKGARKIRLERYDRRPSVCAHSFGTWIIANAMLKYSDIKIDKLILSGSVLPRNFDWHALFSADQISSVRNETGKQDIWPAVASHFVNGTGDAGSKGFLEYGRQLRNVPFDWFGHSDALMRGHIENFWLPFLCEKPSPLAVLHGRDISDREEFASILDRTGAIDDMVYGHLKGFAEVDIPSGRSLEWIAINPDIYTFLVDRETNVPVGYINAMPLKEDVYEQVRSGSMTDKDVPASGILPFFGPRQLKIYLMSIAVDPAYRNYGDGLAQRAFERLWNGFIDKLIIAARSQACKVTHILATTWTSEGLAICEHLGMKRIGADRFGDGIYELNLQTFPREQIPSLVPSIRKLLTAYDQKSEP